MVKENEDDVRLASLYKYYSLKDNSNDDTLDQHVKRKRIENESIFDSPILSLKPKQIDANNHTTSKAANSNNKEFKIENLRKRLSRSIEEKKINDLIETSPSDLKSLTFDIKKSVNVSRDEKKLGKLVRLNKTEAKECPIKNETKASLVSSQYSDTDSNGSDVKT